MVNYFDSLLNDLLNEDMPVEAFEQQWLDHAHQGEGDWLVQAQVAPSNNNNNTANWMLLRFVVFCETWRARW